MRILTSCRIAATMLLAAAPLHAQGDAAHDRLRAYIDSLHVSGAFPGATVAVAYDHGPVLALAVGRADTLLNAAMTPDARMLAGSVGKTFFAALALALVAEGRLDLDAPISTWFADAPWFPRLPNARDITVRMLMNHTSGLVRYEFNPAFTAALREDRFRVWQPEEQIAFILDSEPPFAAGAGWTYSDTNYILLAMILERVTGARAYDLIRTRFIEPFDLDDTIPSDRPQLPGLVQGYAGEGNPFSGTDAMVADGRLTFNPQFEWGGGGFLSSADDLARWALALWSGRAVALRLLPQVFDGREARGLGAGARYGLGVIITDGPLGTSYGHSGFFPGYLTEMRYWPEAGLAVALQVNTSSGRPFARPPAQVLLEIAQRAR